MGISFKVSRVGTRYRPKPAAVSPEECAASGSSKESSRVPIEARSRREANTSEAANDNSSISVSSKCTGSHMLPDSEDYDTSFTLNLFQEGYFIGKPTEPLIQDVKSVASLHPYDRASESLFSAIETGCLPGDILDDIPSKYTNGTLVCEVRDYRNCTSEQGTSSSTAEGVPVISKIKLRMSLENVVKDIPLVSDESWTYSDLMEFESRVLKALRPELNLDPTPMLDRLCKDPCSIKLNIGLGRKKRLRQTPEVTVTFNNQIHGKKVCIDGVLENANCKPGEPVTLMSNAAVQSTPENAIGQQVSSGMVRSTNFVQESARATLPLPSQVKLQPVLNYPGVVHDRGSASAANFAGVNANISSSQNMMGSYVDAVNSNVPLHVKRDNQDAQLATMPALKRSKQTPVGVDGIQQQQVGSQFGGPNGQDLQWRNQLLQSQSDVKGIQYSMMGGQRYPSQVINNFANQETGASFYFNQPGMRYGLKEEQIETDKVDRQDLERSKDGLPAMTTDNIALDQQQSRSQQLLQQSSMRNHLPPLMQWHNPRPPVDKDTRKDEVKRKTVPSPRVSSGPMVQSPVSSKSGEISSGSAGGQFSAVAAVGSSQKEKATANSNAAVGAPSAVSSPSDSVHRQTHTAAGKPRQKSNSVQKPQAMSGIGSPASVSNMSAPLNANSPSIGTTSIAMSDQLERFAKIETMTQRYQLNIKKKANDPPPRKAIACPSRQEVAVLLSNSFNAEDFTDQTKPMSRSLIHGNVNTCKMRIMAFVHKERAYQGVPTRAFHLVMAERPSDGTVALQYGDADDSGIPNSKDCSLTLPNTNYADLLAAQFCKLMERDEHQKSDDQIRPFQPPMSSASGSQATAPGSAPDTALPEVKNEISPSPLSNVVGSANNGSIGPLNSSQNLPLNARMLASGNNSQALQISQGYFPGAAMPARPQQLDQTLLQQQQQQQQQKLHQQQQQQMQQNPQSQIQQQQLPLPQIQRSSSMLSANPLSQLMGQNSNLQMNPNQMVNNKSAQIQQFQMLQQQQAHQQQQQNPMQRKIMMGLGGAMGIGNVGNNMVGLGNLGNIMGMGGVRGMSSPMGPLSGLGNVSPNQMNMGSASNFSTGMRANQMAVAQAAAIAKIRNQQNRAGIYGQSGIAGLTGNSNQMLPSSAGLSMLGPTLNRANMSPLQRNMMAPMGPPKIPGTNYFLNQHQQLQFQQQQQQPQLQQQQLQQQQIQQQQIQQQLQQQQQQQQQQISSPLQQSQVGSPPVVGSPSAMMMQPQPQQQQQISPQQMGQQSAMSPQLSSGALQQMNNGGNVGGTPASPQLSSQTHGSVGSITSSPMEQLQGANKGGSSV